MKGIIFISFLLLISLPIFHQTAIRPGATGRYCASGSYDINTGQLSDYDDSHYCGVHLIDYRACVSVSYPSNYTEMGCDNDGGIFPTCNHDEDYCYIQGELYICCCNSDHCNDCSNNPGQCVSPLSILTTTTQKPTTPPPTTTSRSCPKGAIKWQSNCYLFEPNQTAFIVAEEQCNNLGGHLTSIHDGFTNNFIAQNAGLYFQESTMVDFWIGGSDMASYGNWTWTDGSNFLFTEWNHNKNATGEDCLSQSLMDGRWNAQDCFKRKPYVCGV
jgi:hypothetical protein